jgi:A/G-specific adenine glycosylase
MRERYGVRATVVETLAPVEHAFTHYALTMHPSRLSAREPGDGAPAECVWLSRADLVGAALPSPIRKLLSAERTRRTP